MSHTETATVNAFAEPAYLAYAMKVVKDRAIPDVEDGIKPVQRRILYAMYQLKLLPQTAKPMKCARVIGDVLGKYHPHGDSAVYEAMVRMAQPFSLRYPLVYGEGNFGSRDGDGAAAMRYTEARLSPISAALLDELTWDTVDFKPTYDNTLTEPTTLPARLPFLLLNGSYGIAVGMATNLLPHHLGEVVEAAKLMIVQPKTTLDELLAVMPGPDFPTGARLISSPEEIRKVYDEGRGSLRLRSRWTVETSGKNGKDWKLLVNELPQDTSTAKVMEAIEELLNPKAPEKNGKKLPHTPEQVRLKKMFGDLIESYVDGSDKDHPVRLVIEPKDRKIDPQALAMALCTHTDMEMNVSPNFVVIDEKGAPRQGGLRDWLSQWCAYRVETVRRRLTDEKARVDRRLHLLAGRLSILDRIEEVIAVLKKSQDPKADLMGVFGLDDVQAEDVLEMRLRQLANLEKTKILDEQAKLRAEQDRLAKLLGDEKSLRRLIVKELDADAKAFGDERRTELAPDVPTNARKAMTDSPAAALMGPEPIAVALTERGWIVWRPAKTWDDALTGEFKIKAGDAVRRVFWGDRSQPLLLLGATGRAYALRLTDLPSKADTAPLTQYFDLPPNERVLEGAIAATSDRLLIAGEGGYGFVVQAGDWNNRMRAGKAFLTLDEGELPLPPLMLAKDVPAEASVLALASDGRAVGFPLAEVKALPKGKGVGLIGLAPGVKLSDLTVLAPGEAASLRTAADKLVALAGEHWAGYLGGRSAGKKGKALHKSAVGAVFDRPGRERHVPAAPVVP